MALSQQVEDSLREAQKHLREALAFAARNEKPYVNVSISTMISDVERIMFLDNIFDKIDNKEDGPNYNKKKYRYD